MRPAASVGFIIAAALFACSVLGPVTLPKKRSGLVSKSRRQTAHFRWERFDSISPRTRISTSSSPMYRGC
jgi:hypothetical protein